MHESNRMAKAKWGVLSRTLDRFVAYSHRLANRTNVSFVVDDEHDFVLSKSHFVVITDATGVVTVLLLGEMISRKACVTGRITRQGLPII